MEFSSDSFNDPDSEIREFVDTQIVSYAYGGNKKFNIKNRYVSSVVVSEFLKMYIVGDNIKSRFYPILLGKGFGRHFLGSTGPIRDKKHSKTSKRRTDQVMISFNGSFDSIVENGSLALQRIFDEQIPGLIYDSMIHLEKEDQKEIKSKVTFLLDNKVKVFPIGSRVVETSLATLANLENKVNFKENFRNSFNDILIAATAFHERLPLQTNDKLLNRIIAEHFGYEVSTAEEKTLQWTFLNESYEDRRKPFESKGYVNRGWQYKMKKSVFT